MKLNRKLMAAVLALSMMWSCIGCSSKDAGSSDSSASSVGPGFSSVSGTDFSVEASAPEQTDFPVTVTDGAGREVTIQSEPEKLVSGYYISTSLLLALGQREKLVGIESKAETRPIYSLAAPGLLELPSVGTAKSFDLEGCAALHPDLVVIPLKLKDQIPALEDLGLTVLAIDPEDLEQLNDTIRMLGEAAGAREEAQALLDYDQQTEEALKGLLSQAERPRVYLAGNSSYLNTAGAKMYQDTMLELGGGTNVAAELEDSYWAEVSYEQLLAWDPEVIIIAAEAAYTKDDLLQDPQLAQLDAVKNGRVYAMPSGLEAWDSPIPSAMLGSRWTASVLHGDLYPFETFQTDAVEFYQRFYQFQADLGLLTR